LRTIAFAATTERAEGHEQQQEREHEHEAEDDRRLRLEQRVLSPPTSPVVPVTPYSARRPCRRRGEDSLRSVSQRGDRRSVGALPDERDVDRGDRVRRFTSVVDRAGFEPAASTLAFSAAIACCVAGASVSALICDEALRQRCRSRTRSVPS
jgi:hypothetical protein